MANQPQAGKSLDPAVVAAMAKAAAQQQKHQAPHHAAAPSQLSRLIAAAIWLAFFASLVAVFATNR